MTVSDLLAILRKIDPSRTVAVVNPYRGKGKCYCTPRVAEERTLIRVDGGLYYPEDADVYGEPAVVFMIEG